MVTEYLDNPNGESFGFYSREAMTDLQMKGALDAYKATNKQTFDPSVPGSIMVLPELTLKTTTIPQAASHLRSLYDEYLAKPISDSVDSVVQNPGVQSAVGQAALTGFGDPRSQGLNLSQQGSKPGLMSEVNEVGKGALSIPEHIIKSTANDPAVMALTVLGGPTARAVSSLAPIATGVIGKFVAMAAGEAALYTSVETATNPNANFSSTLKTATAFGSFSLATRLLFAGYGGVFKKELTNEVKDTLVTDLQSKVFDKYNVEGFAINPESAIKDLGYVIRSNALKELQSSSTAIRDYISTTAPKSAPAFNTALDNVEASVAKLSGLEINSRGFSEELLNFTKSMQATANIHLGIGTTGLPTTVNEKLIGFFLSQDEQFVKPFMAATQPRVLASKGYKGGVSAKETERALNAIDPSTKQPTWKGWATQDDLARVQARFNIGTTAAASSAELGTKQALDTWRTMMQGLVDQSVDFSKGNAILNQLTSKGIADTRLMRQEGLEIAKKYNTTQGITAKIIETVYNNSGASIQQLSKETIGSIAARASPASSTTNQMKKNLSSFNTAAINNTTLQSLRSFNE